MGKLKLFYISNSAATVYHPGSVVEGKVVLELTGPQSVKSITITMSGKARVKFQKCFLNMREYSESETILADIPRRLWGNDIDSQQIEAGRHEFPFSFQLPSTSLPTSHERENANSDRKGYIRYSLNATLKRSWKFKDHASAAFKVEDIVNVNTPQLSTPQTNYVERRKKCCSCLTSGPISVTVETDKGGYCPGESIVFSVKVENNGNRRIIAVRGLLKKTILYSAKSTNWVTGTRAHCRETKDLFLIDGPQAGPGGQINWNDRLPIPLATNPTSSDNCRIIRVYYALNVEVVITWAKNMVVNVPIVIGNTSFQPAMTNTNTSQLLPTNSQPIGHFHTANPGPVIPFQTNANTYQPTAAESGFMQVEKVSDTCQHSAANPDSLQHPTNTYRPPATNPEFMSGAHTFQPSVTNPGTTYAPVTEDASLQTRDSQFAPLSDLVTNYNVDQPPSYDSVFNT